MRENNDDLLGGYDELELVELSETESHGGVLSGPWCIATVTLVSAAACPTTKCTSQC
ncbi:class II lanthipeptide, LchA2/BrtA2 family [Streptomyces sp. NPDC057509]|uniref:class II lanthipeptide, LchA2/BrtA2 family n=1 Tax=Streptomyces sp. NPDC057509 TaxID=3346152 RepID=UPI0036C1E4B1